MNIHTKICFFLFCGVIGYGVPEASAQNALGGGDALDANLQMRDGRRVRRNTAGAKVDYNARNLLITGNVAGGRGFRGSVGYTAANDFRTDFSSSSVPDSVRQNVSLGSDNLYSFRADSALSSINFINSGSTYSRMKYAQDIGLMQFDRAGRGATIGDVSPEQGDGRSRLNAERLRLDYMNIDGSSFTRGSSSTEPSIVGGGYNAAGDLLYIQTSSLQGMVTSLGAESGKSRGLSVYDTIRMREEQAGKFSLDSLDRQSKVNFSTIQPHLTEEKAEPSDLAVTGRTVSTDPTDYRTVLERIATRYAGAENVDIAIEPGILDRLSTQYEQLRVQLHGGVALRTPTAVNAEADQSEEKTDSEKVEEEVDDMGKLLEALKHNEFLGRYSTDAESRFNEIMRQGEQRLAKGDYFWAERRFAHALRFQKSNPLALAGIVHAQIGAEVYPSAAYGVRELLVEHPEMIATRYEAGMIPTKESLDRAVIALKARIERGQGSIVLESSLLLAYVGHLLDDRGIILEGLDALKKADAKDSLEPFLRSLWLGGEAEK